MERKREKSVKIDILNLLQKRFLTPFFFILKSARLEQTRIQPGSDNLGSRGTADTAPVHFPRHRRKMTRALPARLVLSMWVFDMSHYKFEDVREARAR